MIDKEPQLRIGAVARAIGVSPSTIRAWEREGLISPSRADGHHRRYTQDQIAELRRIRPLLLQSRQRQALREVIGAGKSPSAELAGARLRALRVRDGRSLRSVARQAGISGAYLSLIERGLATPTVAMMQRLATATGVTVLDVFGAGSPPETGAKLVRATDRRKLEGFDGVEMEDLVRVPGAVLQVEIFTVRPGGGSGGSYAHEGEEAIFVLEGRMQVWLDDREQYELGTGDCLYFGSAQSHRWHNPGTEPAKLFWVNTPPTF